MEAGEEEAIVVTENGEEGVKEMEVAEQVMSEVHLGCPPRFSGPYISRFTFAIPQPGNLGGRYKCPLYVEGTPTSQMPCLDQDGDLVLTRRDNRMNLSSEKLNISFDIVSNCSCISNAFGWLSGTHKILALYNKVNSTFQMAIPDCHSDPFSMQCNECCYLVTSQPYYPIFLESSLNCEVTIQHRITSSIPSVGLQVWKAALLLADFILHTSFTSSEFDDITALELGAGTGLVGVLLAPVAETVYITDFGVEILDNCVNNVHLNSNMFKFHETSVCVRELDWRKPWPPVVENCPSQQRSGYSWTSSDIERAERATLLLAADVIYSDELTDSFFHTLENLMSHGCEKVLYLALEKRYNFSIDDLDIVANGYFHFRSFLHEEEECDDLEDGSPSCFLAKRIDLAQIPQYIKEYDRGKDLELWKITCAPSK